MSILQCILSDMAAESQHEALLQAAAGSLPDIERFLRSYRSVNHSLDAIERSFVAIGRGQDGHHDGYVSELAQRLRVLDEQRRGENYRAWATPLSAEAKAALLELLHQQDLVVERLQQAIASGAARRDPAG